MKQAVLFIFICLTVGCASTQNSPVDMSSLNGVWVPVEQEIGGNELSKHAFENRQLTISNSNYSFVAESTDKNIVKSYGNKLDIYGKEGVNSGRHFTAIYKYEDDLLSICYNLSGDSYPETFDTKSKATHFLSVFKKK